MGEYGNWEQEKFYELRELIPEEYFMKTKIFIVDDDISVRDIFRIILKKAGYDIQLFESGNDLFENAKEIPDLFILDQQLPGIDGLEICKGLKDNEKTKKIPVIIISATPDIEEAVRHACADEFLKKPLTKKDLLETIKKYVGVGVSQ